MFKSKLIATSLALLALPAFAHHGNSNQSDKVPSSHLIAAYYIFPSDTAGMAQVYVELDKVKVKNGTLTVEELTPSIDDVITVSNGSSKVVYNPDDDSANVLPMVSQGTYDVTFNRANGDVFKSTISMPNDVVFTAPAANAVFNNSTVIDVTWQPPVDPAFLAGVNIDWYADCTPTGDLSWASDNSIEFPAGLASQCQGIAPVTVEIAFAEQGQGYGQTLGITFGSIDFSYSSDAAKYGFKQGLAKTIKHQFDKSKMLQSIKTAHKATRPALLVTKQAK